MKTDMMQKEMPWSQENLDRIVQGLTQVGWFALEGMISPALCADLIQVIEQRDGAGQFKRAGIGRGAEFRVDSTVRTDRVHWIDQRHLDLTPPEKLILEMTEAIKAHLNQKLFLGLTDFEGHFAIYEEGGHYGRHLDQFHGQSARTVSLVLYLNQDRKPNDGGILRLYDPREEEQVLHEVVPHAGTMVLFMSAEIPHEVTRSHKKRFSVTGWYRTRPTSLGF